MEILNFVVILLLLVAMFVLYRQNLKLRLHENQKADIKNDITQMRNIGELSVFRIYSKEIVTKKDDAIGGFWSTLFGWSMSKKQIAIIFEFEIEFIYDLMSSDFSINSLSDMKYSIKMPPCSYKYSIKDMKIYDEKNAKFYDALNIKIPEKIAVFNELKRFKEFLAPYIANTTEMLWKALDENKKVLVEGAQGSLLDIDHGTYPYVTSSNTVASGACTGLGLAPKDIGEVIGIVKAYTTRVGNGAFPSEANDEWGEKMCQIGKEFGTTTGRKRRCGWFDAVCVKYSARLSGIDKFALMKLDVLDGFEKVKICTAYKLNGEIIDYFPCNLESVEPVYEEMDGWNSIKGVKKFSDLPENAQKYIKRIEELTNMRAGFISTSPERDDTIIL